MDTNRLEQLVREKIDNEDLLNVADSDDWYTVIMDGVPYDFNLYNPVSDKWLLSLYTVNVKNGVFEVDTQNPIREGIELWNPITQERYLYLVGFY